MEEPNQQEQETAGCGIFLLFGSLCFLVGIATGYWLQLGAPH